MNVLNETDYGTPASHSDVAVTLEIDGVSITVPKGTSVMRAATEAGVNVPKLCATDSLDAFGSCRLCLVEIEGRKGYPASCTTPCEPGMKVKTQTNKLADIRKGVMELYISDHPLDCLTCPTNDELFNSYTNSILYHLLYGYITPVGVKFSEAVKRIGSGKDDEFCPELKL